MEPTQVDGVMQAVRFAAVQPARVLDAGCGEGAVSRRVFAERALHERLGREKDYRVVKIPGRWKPGEFPPTLEPIEFGSVYVSYTVR